MRAFTPDARLARCPCGCGGRVRRGQTYATKTCWSRGARGSRSANQGGRRRPLTVVLGRQRRVMQATAAPSQDSWWLDYERFYEVARERRSAMRTSGSMPDVTHLQEGRDAW